MVIVDESAVGCKNAIMMEQVDILFLSNKEAIRMSSSLINSKKGQVNDYKILVNQWLLQITTERFDSFYNLKIKELMLKGEASIC